MGQTAVQPDDAGDVEAAWRDDLAQRPGTKTRRDSKADKNPAAPAAKKAPATQRVTRAFQATSNWKLAASPAGTGETGETGLARIYADG